MPNFQWQPLYAPIIQGQDNPAAEIEPNVGGFVGHNIDFELPPGAVMAGLAQGGAHEQQVPLENKNATPKGETLELNIKAKQADPWKVINDYETYHNCRSFGYPIAMFLGPPEDIYIDHLSPAGKYLTSKIEKSIAQGRIKFDSTRKTRIFCAYKRKHVSLPGIIVVKVWNGTCIEQFEAEVKSKPNFIEQLTSFTTFTVDQEVLVNV